MPIDNLDYDHFEIPESRYLVISKKSFEHLYIVPQWNSSLDIEYTWKEQEHKLKIEVSSNCTISEDICVCVPIPK